MLTKSFVSRKVISRILLKAMLLALFIMSQSTLVRASDAGVLSEVRAIIGTQYVETVSSDVLSAPTIEETLKRLGDPHTMYFTPEQYQEFVGSINMSFSGIGVHIEMLPEGVKVLSVISGSPAMEVGLKPGDVIIGADGKSLEGLSSEEAVSLLRGLEGSIVQIKVKQELEIRDFTVTRRTITEPTVTGEVLSGHIGYLDLNTFGSDTPKEFEKTVNQLKAKNVDSWVVDLRDNGGGYLSSALDLAGYFIGSDVAVSIKDRTGGLYPYQAPDPGWRLNQPIIFLINENSASASEILAAAVKDHEKATLVGTTTYGKGTVQSMFPLKNGGVLKMTVDHFYSPLGKEIDAVGVSPDVFLEYSDPLKAAELMLSKPAVALAKAQTDDYWEAWQELSSINAGDEEISAKLTDYYPSYRQVAALSEVPLDKKFTVNFSADVNWQSVNNSSIELINSSTGERINSTFKSLGSSSVQVIPEALLSPDRTYWLVIHPTILGVSGKTLQEGAIAVAQTIQETKEYPSTWKIQSYSHRVKDRAYEGNRMRPGDLGYGLAIKDLELKR